MPIAIVNKSNVSDLEDAVWALLCSVRVAANFAEQTLNSAASGHPFDREDANASVWALHQMSAAAERLGDDFREVLDAHFYARRQS